MKLECLQYTYIHFSCFSLIPLPLSACPSHSPSLSFPLSLSFSFQAAIVTFTLAHSYILVNTRTYTHTRIRVRASAQQGFCPSINNRPSYKISDFRPPPQRSPHSAAVGFRGRSFKIKVIFFKRQYHVPPAAALPSQ